MPSKFVPLAITMGDPAGIGPEIVVRAAASSRVRALCRLTVLGDAALIDRAARVCGVDLRRTAIAAVRQVGREHAGKAWPKPGRATGEAAFQYLDTAARSVLAGEHAALVTAPINKLWLNRAGHDYDGHTGYLSALTGKPATMMLASWADLGAQGVGDPHAQPRRAPRGGLLQGARGKPMRVSVEARPGNGRVVFGAGMAGPVE